MFPTSVTFGSGKYTSVVQKEVVDEIAEQVVRDVCAKLPSNTRTPEIIRYVIERAKELSDCMLLTYAFQPNPEEHMR